MNPKKQKEAHEQVEKLLEKGFIRPSESPWASPIVMVPKKNGTWRMCVDFRKINEIIRASAHPLPHIDNMLDRLKNFKYISTLDLESGYHQIPLDEASKLLTAFTSPNQGLYEYNVLPFGLKDAPSAFQALMDKILRPLLMEGICLVYLDDIIVGGKTYEEHRHNLERVLELLLKAQLKVNWDKSKFLMSKVKYLGFIVGDGKITVDPEKVAAVRDFAIPRDKKDIRAFLGLVGYYRRQIPMMATKAEPLNKMLRKEAKWHWGSEQQEAFETLKEYLASFPLVHCPDYTHPFIIATDASDYGIGGVIYQTIDGEDRVVAYCSKTLSAAERNYGTFEKECYAVLHAVTKFRHYIDGLDFTVITDHAALKWLFKIQEPTGRVARWIFKLSQFDFVITHRKGCMNKVPDALSRLICNHENLEEEDDELFHVNLISKDSNEVELMRKLEDFSRVKDAAYVNLREDILEAPEKFPQFKVENNVIYKIFGNPLTCEDRWLIYVPQDFRKNLIENFHNHPVSGHMGVERTLLRIRANHYWPKMEEDVKYFVAMCNDCTQYKPWLKNARPPMKGFVPRMTPGTAYAIDIVGPLPGTHKKQYYIFTAVDLCSKWMIAKPMPAATAYNVARILRLDLILQFGPPELLVSDNGVQFISDLLRKVCRSHGIRHNFIPVYCPENNNVERYHQTLKSALRMYVSKNQKHWDVYLPYVVHAMNTACSTATKFTPAELFLGRKLRSLFDLQDSIQQAGGEVGEFDEDQYCEARREIIEKVMAQAHENIKKQQERVAKRYNLRAKEIKYSEGDMVWRRNFPKSSKIDFITAKFEPKFLGPCVITEVVAGSQLRISNLNGKDLGLYSAKNLRPFVSLPLLRKDETEEGKVKILQPDGESSPV